MISNEVTQFMGLEFILLISNFTFPFTVMISPVIYLVIFKSYYWSFEKFCKIDSISGSPNENTAIFINRYGLFTYLLSILYITIFLISPYDRVYYEKFDEQFENNSLKLCGPFELDETITNVVAKYLKID